MRHGDPGKLYETLDAILGLMEIESGKTDYGDCFIVKRASASKEIYVILHGPEKNVVTEYKVTPQKIESRAFIPKKILKPGEFYEVKEPKKVTLSLSSVLKTFKPELL